MSTFNGIVKEFPRIQIDNFRVYESPPLACFLSHIHSDHLTNLDIINSPFVYCTAPTRELLLKLEKFPHRMNFAKGILEARKQTYRKIKRLLKPIPLEMPTTIELTHGYTIRVTLFDANHCTGACMFLIQGDNKAILYTGDIRSEPWWVNSLVRNPIMLPYARGHKRLDNIYLDTTFASGSALKMDFPSKADGITELLSKVSEYPDDTVFYMHAWTFGYEQVWVALSNALQSRIHLCDYRYRVYSSMKNVPECFGSESAALLGFQLGNSYHQGCLTRDPDNVRIHSCERGTKCDSLQNSDFVTITPIITRYAGQDVAEVGAGGGHGDLDQKHDLELNDLMGVAQLLTMCKDKLATQPALQIEVSRWLKGVIEGGGASTVKLDFAGFWDHLQVDDAEDLLDDIPIDRLVSAIARLFTKKSGLTKDGAAEGPRCIHFPFSRHSSYNELRDLVKAFRPRDLYPCTVDPTTWTEAVSMKTLFGDLCSADIFAHDQIMQATKCKAPVDPLNKLQAQSSHELETPPRKCRTSSERQSSNAMTVSPVSVKKARRGSPGDDARERARRRASIAKSMLEGAPWRPLQSVSGYYREEPEKEL